MNIRCMGPVSQAGVQEDDEYMAQMVRHLKMPVVLCVNKCENPKTASAAAQVLNTNDNNSKNYKNNAYTNNPICVVP